MALSKQKRQVVFDLYDGRCAYCGCVLEKGWHVDHVIPCGRQYKSELVKAPNGKYKYKTTLVGYDNIKANVMSNFVPACPSCNINKHGMDVEQFRIMISTYLNSLNTRMVQYKMVKKYGLVVETEAASKPVVFYFETFKNTVDNASSEPDMGDSARLSD